MKLVLSISALVASTAVSADGVQKIKLKKIPEADRIVNLLSSNPNPTLGGVSAPISSSRRLGEPKKGENIVLRDLKNAQYYGPVTLGTPPKVRTDLNMPTFPIAPRTSLSQFLEGIPGGLRHWICRLLGAVFVLRTEVHEL